MKQEQPTNDEFSRTKDRSVLGSGVNMSNLQHTRAPGSDYSVRRLNTMKKLTVLLSLLA